MGTETICTVIGLSVIAAFVVFAVLFTAAQGEAEKARKDYLRGLERLKADPHSPELRETTLALGRKYARLVRSSGGATVFDEVALMNDINAACARAGSLPPTGTALSPAEVRLASLEGLRSKGLITDGEYADRRRQIIEEI
jgi:hypothetical protein